MSDATYGAEWRRYGDNPVMRAARRYDCGGVADPFALVVDDAVWLLYEAIDANGDATIAAAHSNDGRTFERYAGNPVFDEYRHHSYPATVRLGDEVYMTPERLSQTVPVWKTSVEQFPEGWHHVQDLTFETRVVDPTPFVHDGDLYLAVATRLVADDRRYFNRVFALDDLEAGVPRVVCDIYPDDPTSSVVSERSAFPVSIDDGVVLFHQADEELAPDGLYGDGDGCRGDQVHALELRALSPAGTTVRRAADNPVLTPTGDGWESVQVHSLSIVAFDGEWLGYYDGQNEDSWCGIGLLELGERPEPVSDVVGEQRHGDANPNWSADREPQPGVLYDDFTDDSLHCRDETLPPRESLARDYHLLRPVWTVGDGRPDASGAGVTFTPHEQQEIRRYADGRGESWSLSLRIPPDLSSGTIRWYPRGPVRLSHWIAQRAPGVDGRRLTTILGQIPLVNLDIAFWRVSITADDGRCRLERRRNGRTHAVIDQEVTLSPGEHDVCVRLTDAGRLTLSWNSRRLGTATERFERDVGASRIVATGLDETVTLTELRVE